MRRSERIVRKVVWSRSEQAVYYRMTQSEEEHGGGDSGKTGIFTAVEERWDGNI